MNEVLSRFKSFQNDIIVFSHLRWEFVFQRPQHLLSRLGKDRKILFIEEPIEFNESDKGSANIIKDRNITVLQPRIDRSNMVEELTPIVREFIKKLKLNNPI